MFKSTNYGSDGDENIVLVEGRFDHAAGVEAEGNKQQGQDGEGDGKGKHGGERVVNAVYEQHD